MAASSPFTPAQWRAITTVTGGVLVPAAAGSGKTATLAERVAHLVCGDGERRGCDIEQVLVLTFTRNAAAEMKARIENVLRRRAQELAGTPCGAHAAEQVLLLGRAQVSTIDSFCQRLVRQHFQQLGLDPRFGILPGEDTAILQAQALRTVIDEVLHDESASASAAGDRDDRDLRAARDLIEWYGNGDEDRVMSMIRDLSNLWGSLVDPEAWRTRALARLEDGAANPRDSELGHEFERAVGQRIEEIKADCHGTIPLLSDFPQYVDYIRNDLLGVVAAWEEQATERGVWELEPAVLDKLPSVKSGVEGKEDAKKLMDRLKDAVNDGPHPGGWGSASEAFWQKSLKSVAPRMRELLRLGVRFEEVYGQLKALRRVMDFADVQREALKLLRRPDGTPSDVALDMHRQFEHVLIDECQDINELQNTILSLVSRECLSAWHDRSGRVAAGQRKARTSEKHMGETPMPPKSNLFSVGDVKQSVYRFRLAEPGLFMRREALYRRMEEQGHAGTVVPLSENFRSRGKLLDAVNAVFERLMVGGRTEVDYSRGHELREGKPIPPATFTGAPLELHLLPKSAAVATVSDAEETKEGADTDDLEAIEREAVVVARRMREMMGLVPGHTRATVFDKSISPGGAVRDIRWSDMAVLLRVARVKAKLFASVLRRHAIPVYAEVRGGLLEAQEVRDVLSLLDLLDNPGRDIALAAYLRSPLSLMPHADEAMARARAAADPKVPFHQAVLAWANGGERTIEPNGDTTLYRDEYQAGLADAIARLRSWRELARRRTIADVLEAIYADTYYPTYVLGLSDGPQRQANLVELLQKARTYASATGGEGRGAGGGDVAAFTDFLADLQDTDAGAEPDQPALSNGGDFVTLQTIHKSKGLEYSVVFVPDLGNRFTLRELNASVLLDRDTLLSPKAIDESKNALYPTPAWLLARSVRRGPLLAEELRVLYVALTRAREHLVLVGSGDPGILDTARKRWGTLNGNLPEASVMAMSSQLDWLLAAGCAAEGTGQRVFDVRQYDPSDVARWKVTGQAGDGVPDWARHLDPIPGSEPDPDAEREADRIFGDAGLMWLYPHDDAANRPGSISVTTLTKGAGAKPVVAPPGYAETEDDEVQRDHAPLDVPPANWAKAEPADYERRLVIPAALAEFTPEIRQVLTQPLTGADLGTATHKVFEFLDFSIDPTDARLQAFLDQLVATGRLTPRESASISLESLRIAMTDPQVGPLLRGEHGRVHRELEIHLPLDEPGVTGMDRTMIRGRIDVLVETPDGPVVIDYKTDNVQGQRLADRIELYRGQVNLYRSASRKITGREAAAVYLVFVHPSARQVVKVL
jgi:ATP-dependent helicase/nuclease subunit A